MLRELSAMVPRKYICAKYGIRPSTLSVLSKKKDEIEKNFATYSGNMKRNRSCAHPELDTALMKWYEASRNTSDITITNPLLQAKANELAKTLNIQLKTDAVTGAWIDRFKDRHGISFRCPANSGITKEPNLF